MSNLVLKIEREKQQKEKRLSELFNDLAIDPKEKADYSSRAIGFRNYVINTNHSSVFSVSAI